MTQALLEVPARAAEALAPLRSGASDAHPPILSPRGWRPGARCAGTDGEAGPLRVAVSLVLAAGARACACARPRPRTRSHGRWVERRGKGAGGWRRVQGVLWRSCALPLHAAMRASVHCLIVQPTQPRTKAVLSLWHSLEPNHSVDAQACPPKYYD